MTGPSTAPGGAGDEPPLVPESSTRTRRVVLGLAAVLVVVVGGGAAALALSADAGREGDDRPPAAGGPSPGAVPSAGASAPFEASPGVGGAPSVGVPGMQDGGAPPVPPDDAFRPVPRLCEEADFSPVFDILAQVQVLRDDEVAGPTLYQRSCTFRLEAAGSVGTFQLDVSVYSSPDEAQGWFDDILTAESRGGQPHEELAGDWDANAMLAITAGREQADVRFLARDETLVLKLSTFILGDAADEAAQQAAVLEIAAQLRETTRA
jgi:hypothetical protein